MASPISLINTQGMDVCSVKIGSQRDIAVPGNGKPSPSGGNSVAPRRQQSSVASFSY